MKPLDGIRVLDLSRVLAGPYATALMADLGAEIIKIEPPQGDDYRHIGPFLDGESALFTLNNRGKQSLALDLKDPAHLHLAQAIAARVDVVVENFRPGVAARLGLGADALRGNFQCGTHGGVTILLRLRHRFIIAVAACQTSPLSGLLLDTLGQRTRIDLVVVVLAEHLKGLGEIVAEQLAEGLAHTRRHRVIEVRHALTAVLVILVRLNCNTCKCRI